MLSNSGNASVSRRPSAFLDAAFRFGTIGLLGLAIVACAGVSRAAEFSVIPMGDRLQLNIYMPKTVLHGNIHGGNSDRYSFLIPKGGLMVRAEDILQFSVNEHVVPPGGVTGGYIEIEFDVNECRLRVDLLGADAKPLIFNGLHKVKYCGQQYL
ncbi:hypothetical protein [Mitsuaria sp. 7]|uniref:hypothetical protein n=1 Tax=Mitsuaria sp. 7 TaxID=1658665 RepID=UPI0012F9D8B8|nr:hypothetical protein [Mitsuaria sp. 7]